VVVVASKKACGDGKIPLRHPLVKSQIRQSSVTTSDFRLLCGRQSLRAKAGRQVDANTICKSGLKRRKNKIAAISGGSSLWFLNSSPLLCYVELVLIVRVHA
jgi:hypothetical protein